MTRTPFLSHISQRTATNRATRRQMDNGKWFWAAIGYMCGFAWVVGLMINQFYLLFTAGTFTVWTVVAIVFLALILFQLFRPMPKYAQQQGSLSGSAAAQSAK